MFEINSYWDLKDIFMSKVPKCSKLSNLIRHFLRQRKTLDSFHSFIVKRTEIYLTRRKEFNGLLRRLKRTTRTRIRTSERSGNGAWSTWSSVQGLNIAWGATKMDPFHSNDEEAFIWISGKCTTWKRPILECSKLDTETNLNGWNVRNVVWWKGRSADHSFKRTIRNCDRRPLAAATILAYVFVKIFDKLTWTCPSWSIWPPAFCRKYICFYYIHLRKKILDIR